MAKKEQYTQGYYYIVPAVLAESGDFYKALLYGLITSLARREDDENGNAVFRGCDASNGYLAKKLNMKSISTVSGYISQLKEEGWLEVEIDKAKGNRRRIYPVGSRPITSEHKTPIASKHKTYAVETSDPYCVKTSDSNISISNTREYLLSMTEKQREKFLETIENNVLPEDLKDERIDKIATYYKKNIGSKLEVDPKLSRKGREKIAIRLRKFGIDQLQKAIDNFSADDWWMENNANRGIAWFFEKDERVTQLINLKPRNGGIKKTYNNEWTQFD